MSKQYSEWFREISGDVPYPWQAAIGTDSVCADRVLRIPTGFGKTAGTALSWLYNRCILGNEAWPRRLVFCLPMRVLVEQTERVLQDWVEKAGLKVPVVVLLGGRDATRDWFENIDQPSIVVGTQDMLLSRALNRGYASARGLWPMEFGALHSDALWVIDEVQLMDVGLATTTQLSAFRSLEVAMGRPRHRPVATWWMSATLQSRWLESIDFKEHVPGLPKLTIAEQERKGGLWEVRKALSLRKDLRTPEEVAELAKLEHQANSLTLVIVNTVVRANAVADALRAAFKPKKTKKGKSIEHRPSDSISPEVCVVHSRFRGEERRKWNSSEGSVLRKGAQVPDGGRIIVATQVVEAGVDISANLLISDLAPWSSLVQRFGRVARYRGENGRVVVLGSLPAKEVDARPYDLESLSGASAALDDVLSSSKDVGPHSLESFEEALATTAPQRIEGLYPYTPEHVLRRPDFDELFDTSADLSGADIDVGRYIRTGDDRDATVFWRLLESDPGTLENVPFPSRDELCPVPIGELKAFLKNGERHAFVFDYLSSAWTKRAPERISPGMTVLLDSREGGYTIERGWDAKSKSAVPPIEDDRVAQSGMLEASLANDEDPLSLLTEGYKTIQVHGWETKVEVGKISQALGLAPHLLELLGVAARWHDAGKGHPVFQAAIRQICRQEDAFFGPRNDLAKAPRRAWHRPAYVERPGFRHELASTLLMFEVLRRKDPFHPALLGPHRDLLALLGTPGRELAGEERLVQHPLAVELATLSAEEFDLVAYLVCAHHGKVRCRWASTPQDIEAGHGGIHGVVADEQGKADTIPSLSLADDSGAAVQLPATSLSLSAAALGVGATYGASWTDRCQRLVEREGPFTLALLETVIRVADWRASKLPGQEAK